MDFDSKISCISFSKCCYRFSIFSDASPKKKKNKTTRDNHLSVIPLNKNERKNERFSLESPIEVTFLRWVKRAKKKPFDKKMSSKWSWNATSKNGERARKKKSNQSLHYSLHIEIPFPINRCFISILLWFLDRDLFDTMIHSLLSVYCGFDEFLWITMINALHTYQTLIFIRFIPFDRTLSLALTAASASIEMNWK